MSNEDNHSNFREAHRVLLEILQNLTSAEASLEDSIEVGSVLWDMSDAIEAAMGRIKDAIREQALSDLGGGAGTVEYRGSDLGQVSVNVPKPSLKVPKAKTLEELKSALGADFGLFFEENISYKVRPEFRDRVKAVSDPLHQKALLGAVEASESKPRVSFRRFPSLKAKSIVEGDS